MQGDIIDVHSHIQFPAYDEDREAVIERAKKAGVKMLAVGTQISTSEAGIKLAYQYSDDIWATAGFHPSHVIVGCFNRSVGATDKWHYDSKEQKEALPERFDIKRLRKLAGDSKVVAIGECGLDYYRLATSDERLANSIKERQKEVFLAQAELAKELNKPLMIHCRPSKGTDDAYEDLIQIIDSKFQILKIVHFYVGSLEITEKLVEAGFYFTFGGVITFTRDYDEVIKHIPIGRILLETDCPYVAPAPFRGKRNEPAYIIETTKKLAEIKNLKLDIVSREVYKTSCRIFNLSTSPLLY